MLQRTFHALDTIAFYFQLTTQQNKVDVNIHSNRPVTVEAASFKNSLTFENLVQL